MTGLPAYIIKRNAVDASLRCAVANFDITLVPTMGLRVNGLQGCVDWLGLPLLVLVHILPDCEYTCFP